MADQMGVAASQTFAVPIIELGCDGAACIT
jgi:hypothetical protein